MEVIHRLRDAGLIGFRRALKAALSGGVYMRIWPSETLMGMFRRLHLACFILVMLKAEKLSSSMMRIRMI